ncbi:MAG: hypothetical protein G3M78_04090 [Candidatus Nitrohelix vancouverensis]|uniref:Uncharacterized protein n=1 Tax=Candidatus Nitrohelix vancouverensis TaxID=2705534 RepID=A0A7T0C140_9BACT|nr:MAG: hypothetical protein G3M78_04090 [Candidatus Nitrohelix vancouverensis]
MSKVFYKRKSFWIIFMIFILALLYWNFLKEKEQAERQAYLDSQVFFFRDLYHIDVPKEYLWGIEGNKVRLRAAYPGMVPFTKETAHRFATKLPSESDRVSITLENVPPSNDPKDLFNNKNNPGRYTTENTIPRFPSIKKHPLPDGIKESDKITRYTRQTFESMDRYSGTFVITQDNDRLSTVTCILLSCIGKTTWNGDFKIEYMYLKKHFNNMVSLDESVFNLITSFNPKPIQKNKEN